MTENPQFPALRSDLEFVQQAAPGKSESYLVKDPDSGTVLRISDKEAFICDHLDGETSLREICGAFRKKFELHLELGQLEAFVRQLEELGLLAFSSVAASRRRWQGMRPLDVDANRFFSRLLRVFGWVYTLPAKIAFAATVLIALRIIGGELAYIVDQISSAFGSDVNRITPERVVQVALFFLFIPLLRELAKGLTFAHYGYYVHEIRYRWHLRMFPRFTVNLSGMIRMPTKQKLHVLASGLLLELFLISAGIIFWHMLSPSNPLKTIFSSLVIGATLRFVFNLNPLGKMDGSLVFALLVNKRSFRNRAVRVAHAWLAGNPVPEPMPSEEWRKFLIYGLLVDLYSVTIFAAIFYFLGYWLTSLLQGLGLLIFLVVVWLAIEEPVRALFSGFTLFGGNKMRRRQGRRWVKVLWFCLFVGVVLALYFIPYPFEVSGEFRVQPYLKREIRSEVKGLIDSVAYEEGAEVKKNDVLFRLSNRELEQEYYSAKASLERETQQLRELLAPPKPEEIALQNQKIKLAETSLRHSEVLLKQYAALVKEGSVAERDYNKVLKERDMDRESVEVAKLELEDLLAGAKEEAIAAQRAEVERLSVSLQYYGNELARMTVRSPIDGRVTTLYVQAKTGGRVEAGDVLAVVENTKKVIVRIAVPEEVAGLVSVGAGVRARPWAYSDRDFVGEVTTIMPVAVEKTEDLMKQESSEEEGGMVRNMSMPQEKVVPILAETENENRLLKTDMTGYAKIEVGDRSLGYALFHPIIRFFRVLVWSWIP